MKLVLHIGTRKTGTTTIQRAVKNDEKQLNKIGVCILDFGSDNLHEIALSIDYSARMTFYYPRHNLVDKGDISDFSNIFFEKLRLFVENSKSEYHTLIISSEDLSYFTNPDEISVLYEKLRNLFESIKVITYLRRQDRYVISDRSTAVKNGFHVNFDKFFCVAKEHLFFSNLLDSWASSFGSENIIARVFEREKLNGKDLVSDFYWSIGLDIESTFSSQDQYNESLGYDGLLLLNELNRIIPMNVDGKQNTARIGIVSYISQITSSDKRKFNPGKGKALDFLRQFEADNISLHKKYFSELPEVFSQSMTEYDGDVSSSTLSCDKLISIIGDIWSYHRTQAKLLKIDDRYADFLLDLAISFEYEDSHKSRNLMNLAHVIRSKGEVINKV